MSLYLVTGASGFVGRALCLHLRHRGHRVRALLHTDSNGPWDQAVHWDLCRSTLPDNLMTAVDGLFHCAGAAHFRALSRQQHALLWQLNVDASERLFASAASAGVRRLVFFSSVQAAGSPGETRVTEQWDALPDNIYGESKLAAEALLHRAAQNHGLHACILRPALVYGPGVKGNLERMLRAIAKGRMPSLPDSGKQRSMVALDNLIDAAWLAMDRDRANRGTYIVCDDNCYSTRRIYEAIHQILDRPLPRYTLPLVWFKWGARLGDLGNTLTDNAMPWDSAAYRRLFGNACYSADKLKGELGWRPRVDFEHSLPAMVKALDRTLI